jgi:RNA methyltransferase, TrmH family
VRQLRLLTERRSARQAEGLFVVEGAKLLAEALTARAAIDSVFIDDDIVDGPALAVATDCEKAGARVRRLQPGVLARASGTVTPQPVAATVGLIDVDLEAVAASEPTLVVVCAEVRDPGNLGTIVRSAGAAGAGAVVCCAGSVDIYNPKSVRASAGVLFRLPVVAGPDERDVLDEMGRWGLRRWATAAEGGTEYTTADLAQPTALVFGNESHGLSPALASRIDGTLTIPMAAGAESLNVAAAASVLCFEAARQRRAALGQDG